MDQRWLTGGPVHVVAPDGAWTWFNDDRALLLAPDGNGRGAAVLVGHVRRDGRVAATAYCWADGRRQEHLLGAPQDAEADDHNNPAFCHLGDGRILAVWARHGTDRLMRWCHATRDPATGRLDWSAETAMPVPAAQCYANLFAQDGRVHNISRTLNWNPTLFTSHDQGHSWSDPVALIRTGTGGTRPYARFAGTGGARTAGGAGAGLGTGAGVGTGGRIDILYTDGHPRETASGVHHLYLTQGRLYATDGTPLGVPPLDHDTGPWGALVHGAQAATPPRGDAPQNPACGDAPQNPACGDAPQNPACGDAPQNPASGDAPQNPASGGLPLQGGRAWIWDICGPGAATDRATDPGAGHPSCLYQLRWGNLAVQAAGGSWQDDRIWYCHARWDGARWQSRVIAQAGRPLYWKERDYAGGAALDPQDPLRVVISSNAADPFAHDDLRLTPEGRYHLHELRLTPAGAVAAHRRLIRPADALRPRILRPARPGDPGALCWMEGRYDSYKQFETRIMGCFS